VKDALFFVKEQEFQHQGKSTVRMNIIWTKHAEERQKEWEKKIGITRAEVENLLKNPQQIVPGDMDAFVAQSKKGSGLLRVPFKDTGGSRKILTIYWTSKTEKYWKGEENENKI